MERTNMDNLQIAICDDENFFSEKLKDRLNQVLHSKRPEPQINIHTFSSGDELLQNYSNDFSICFLDICMQSENGIETGIKLKELFPETILVFVTAYIEFSLEGYKANAFRYLLKDSLFNKDDVLFDDCIDDIFKKLDKDKQTITFISNGNSVTVKTSSIMYIESYIHEQVIHLDNETILKSRVTLNEFEKQLSLEPFIKPHKSYLVNFKFIENLSGYNIILINGDHIPIARHKYAEFKKAFIQQLITYK